MKFIRAILVVASALSITATASAQHTAGDSGSGACETCAKINNYLGRLSLDPDAAVQMDLPEFVAGLDRTHLLDFVSCITTLLPAHIDKISLATIRSHYLPCMNAAVKRLASEEEMFRRMAMDREMLVDQYLSQSRDIPDEYIGGLLYNFCTLAYYMAGYVAYKSDADGLGFSHYYYNNLHYIEYTLYGDDTYMTTIDPVPEGLYAELWSRFGQYYHGDGNARAEFLICAAVENAYNAGQNELIADNARSLIKLGLHILPLYAQEYIGGILGMAGRAVGREREMTDILKEETAARYGESKLLNIMSTGMEIKQTDSQTLLDFETYRNGLRETGYLFADYWPWLCPEEYIDAENYDAYADYFKECARLLRETWKSMASILYQSPDKNSKIQPILDYFECQTEEVFVMMSFFVANSVFHNGDTALALDIIEPALNYYNGIPIKNIVPYDLMDIVGVYYQLGNVPKVDEILYGHMLPYVEICEYRDEFLYPDLSCTASCAALLAEYHKDQPELAISLADKVISMIGRLQNENEKVSILGILCNCYFEVNDYEKGLEMVDLAMKCDMSDDSRAWLELGGAEINYRLHNWQQAINAYKTYAGQYSSLISAPFYCEMMSCAAHVDDMECMRSTADNYIENIKAEINNKLYNLSSEERERFWSTIADQNLFMEIWEAARGDEERQSILASCAYDYSLMMKGLLLSADNRIDRMLTEHPDSIVRERYAQMKELSARLDNMSMRGGDPTQMQFLREALTTARRDINTAVRRMGIDSDMTGEHTIGWREVQSRLGEHDVAIEFMRLANGEDAQADPLYVAVVLRRGWETPRMVELCRESVLQKYVSLDQMRNRRLYNSFKITELWPLIWQPLQAYIAEGETVYFSADGVMNILNIGAIKPDDSDRRMADERYTLRRLSSTRELCHDRTETKWGNAVLYGGLNYEMGDEALSEATRAYQDVDLGVSRGSSSGNEVPRSELPQTYREAVDIAAMLDNRGIRPDLIVGDKGVEESFKALSGREFELLHIGTHGFYMEGKADYQSTNEELSPMLRSGLVMSGKRNPAPDDREDGLLFAREIADMDLSSVDMVVLSACQTAQGEVTGDGVFGLQRGFKQAGVGTIIMTLWEVHSDMTQYMMTEFYRNLTGGMERHEAFRDAQAKTKNAFSDKDWAAFIMLD